MLSYLKRNIKLHSLNCSISQLPYYEMIGLKKKQEAIKIFFSFFALPSFCTPLSRYMPCSKYFLVWDKKSPKFLTFLSLALLPYPTNTQCSTTETGHCSTRFA